MRRVRSAGHQALWGVLVLVVASTVGCGEVVDPFAPERLDAAHHAPVAIDRAVVLLHEDEWGWRGEFGFTFQNLTALRISIPNCEGSFFLRLDRRQGDEWVWAWSAVTSLCYSPPIELGPEESLSRSLPLRWGHPGGNLVPQPETSGKELEGTYRLVITSAYVNYEPPPSRRGSQPPLEFRTSDPFEVRLAN